MQHILEKAEKIQIVIFDVDGVLTDGRLYVTDQGTELKAFYSRDGLGMRMLQQSGVDIAVITGRTSDTVKHRMTEMRIRHVYQGQHNKLPALDNLIDETGVTADAIAYLGDDIVDLPVMRRVGLAVAVADAHEDVKLYADWQTPNNGGFGAARDLCELIMKAQNTWERVKDYYSF